MRRLRTEFLLMGLIAALAATYPLWLHPTTTLPGGPHPGIFTHVWKYWWTQVALVDLHTNPAMTTMLHHPEGLEVGFYMASFFNGVWTLPITAWAGPVASFNAVVILSTATGFWGAALLASWLGLARWPAAFVGLTWSLCPHHLQFLSGGAIENLANPWVPLFLLAVLFLLREPEAGQTVPGLAERLRSRCDLWAAAGLATCLFLASMTSWYTGLLLASGGAALVVVLLVLRRRPVLGGALWAVAGLLVGALVVLLASRSLLPNPEPLCSLQENIPIQRASPPRATWWLQYVWVGTALVGVMTRQGRFWLLLTLPFVADTVAAPILAQHAQVAATSEWSVSSLASDLLLLDAKRRSLPLHLLVSLAAGFGLTWLHHLADRKGGARAAWSVSLGIGALWAVETALPTGGPRLPVSSFQVQIPSYAGFLAQAEPGAVIDLPLQVLQSNGNSNQLKSLRSQYLLYQTVHGKPVLTAVGTRYSYDLCALPLPDPLLATLHERSLGQQVPLPERLDPALLLRAGYRWVVLHPGMQDSTSDRRLMEDLSAVFGAPSFEQGALVYRIPDDDRAIAAPPGPGAR